DADSLVSGASEEFGASFTVDGLSADLQASSLSALEEATAQLRKVNAAATAQIGAVTEISADLDAFEAQVATLMQTPEDLAEALSSLVASAYSAMVTATTAPARKFVGMLMDAARTLSTFGDDF